MENKLIENSSEKDFEFSPFNKESLIDNEMVWESFDKLVDSYRKNYIRWITRAKREGIRKKAPRSYRAVWKE
jgi:uncharacterized protein YdeI (YjbR/CyaY-like superfamily)